MTVISRTPENTNFLQPTKFLLTFDRIPTVQYFCQEANIPGISLPAITITSPVLDYHVTGNKLNYGTFNIDDCVLVSNQLGNFLAVEHEIEYDRMEVSSPGMDRVIKKESDFIRFNGERATVKLHVPIIEIGISAKAGGKEEQVTKKNFVGFIRGVEDGNLHLECDGKTYKIALTNIDKSRLNPVF